MESDNEIRESEDIIKDMRRKKIHTRLLTWNVFVFAVFGVLYGLMCTKAGLYRFLKHYEPHMVLQTVLPFSILFVVLGIILLMAVGRNRVEKVKIPVVLLHIAAVICVLIGYIVNRQSIGSHMTDYEALAKSYLNIWLIAGLISAAFTLLAAKEEV